MTEALSPPPPQPVLSPDAQAEAARYALLRRLAPSMRHHLVVNLQPIGMIYEVMDRRLRTAKPNLAQVHDSAHKINAFARAALDSCLDVVTWLAPEEGAAVTAEEGVRECLGLLSSGLGFRGYTMRDETGSQPGEVARSSIRNVLTAAVLHLTDQIPPPGTLVLAARPSVNGLELVLALQPQLEDAGLVSEDARGAGPAYRLLDWADLQALAAAERTALARPDARSISLMFRWADPPS